MQKTDHNYFTHQAGEIHSPDTWNHAQLKKPYFLFRDNNRRYDYIKALVDTIADYNTALRNLQSSIELNDNSLNQLNIVMDSAKKIATIQQAYDYQPAGTFFNRIKRNFYSLFYPQTATTVKQSLSVLTLASTEIKRQQHRIEAALYEQHEHAVLNALSGQSSQTSLYKRYNELLTKHGQVDKHHKPQWANLTYCTLCDEANSIIRWLGKSALLQKSEQWLHSTGEDYAGDKQQLFTVATHLSASVTFHSQALATNAATILADWGQWAKRKIAPLDKLSPQANDLCFIFTPIQATAQSITDVYPVLKEAIETAKANQQQQIHNRLDSAEQLALQCIAQNHALLHQLSH